MTEAELIEIEQRAPCVFLGAPKFSAASSAAKGRASKSWLHARSLVDLTHECSVALCEWQAQTTKALILERTGLSEDEARAKGLIA